MNNDSMSHLMGQAMQGFSDLPGKDKKVILYLDDDEMFNRLLERSAPKDVIIKTYTDQDQFRAATVCNGQSLLVIDLKQPIMNGIEFVEQHALNQDKEIIFISGTKPTDEVMAKIESIGASFVHKDEAEKIYGHSKEAE